jgi:putative FmdB family regulatory protein
MPTYTYKCPSCKKVFEILSSIKDYQDTVSCSSCDCKKASRCLAHDVQTLNGSVKLGDNELKTLGHLAQRNTERMSEDQKQSIWTKNNSYKETPLDKPLPKGMSRVKKTPKMKWR